MPRRGQDVTYRFLESTMTEALLATEGPRVAGGRTGEEDGAEGNKEGSGGDETVHGLVVFC